MSDNIDEKILDIINAKERVERYKNLEENEIKIAALNLGLGKVITLSNDENLKKLCRYVLEKS